MKQLQLLFAILWLVPTLCSSQQGQQQFATLGDFRLENRETILDCRIGYRTFGALNSDLSNIVVITTWFTGSSEDMAGLFGPGKLIDSSKYYVIAIDALGNGVSSSPSNSKLQPRMKFPKFSIADIVRSEYTLITGPLHIHHVRAIAGSSSIGGQAALQWLVSYPEFMDKDIALSASPRPTPYDLLVRQSMRDAITSDPLWNHGNYTAQPGTRTIAELASLIDITPTEYNRSHKPEDVPVAINSMAQAIAKFDANDHLRQSEAMSTHDISRAFGGSMEQAAKAVKARVLIIVSATERIENPQPAISFANLIHAETLELHNECGQVLGNCDGEKVVSVVGDFLDRK